VKKIKLSFEQKKTMASQTKMIFIISDEDLIRELSSNKSENTHIIDLDNNEQVNSIVQDNNNIIHSALLAGLSELVRI
jgi:hypothetical protein